MTVLVAHPPSLHGLQQRQELSPGHPALHPGDGGWQGGRPGDPGDGGWQGGRPSPAAGRPPPGCPAEDGRAGRTARGPGHNREPRVTSYNSYIGSPPLPGDFTNWF